MITLLVLYRLCLWRISEEVWRKFFDRTRQHKEAGHLLLVCYLILALLHSNSYPGRTCTLQWQRTWSRSLRRRTPCRAGWAGCRSCSAETQWGRRSWWRRSCSRPPLRIPPAGGGKQTRAKWNTGEGIIQASQPQKLNTHLGGAPAEWFFHHKDAQQVHGADHGWVVEHGGHKKQHYVHPVDPSGSLSRGLCGSLWGSLCMDVFRGVREEVALLASLLLRLFIFYLFHLELKKEKKKN